MKQILKLNKGNYSGNVQQLKEHAGFITSKTVYEDNYNKELHCHENPHISFILQGGNFEYKDHRTTIKNTGAILFYHSGELHKTLPATADTRNLNLEIDTAFLKESQLSETELQQAIAANENSPLFMLRVYAELQNNDSLTETAIHTLLLGFIKKTGDDNFKNIQWCSRLKEILHDQWNENHSLSKLSQHLGVHPVTISKYFTKYFGCTFGEYVRRIRINKSITLIKSSNLSLTEIAFSCGFADQSHFARVFKLYTGLNPKYFQKL